MATQIAEPNDLPSGTITDDNAQNFELLVYQKAQDSAGIKRMGIADWKTYINYDSQKAERLASFVGVDPDYHWDDPTSPMYDGNTVTNRIDTLSTKLGINYDPAAEFTPNLLSRVTTLQTEVETAGTGLIDKVSVLENAVGVPYSGDSLSARVSSLEGTVGDSTDGLVHDVQTNTSNISDLQTTVGNQGTDITNLQTTVGDSSSGLIQQVNANTTDIGNLQTTIGNASSGLVQQVNTNTTDISNIKSTIGSAYVYKGNVTGVDDKDNTTAIIVSGKSQPIPLTDLENAWVYNITPTSPSTTLKMTINGVARTYEKGANIAWVENISDFDELGTAIDVTKVEQLETKVNNLDKTVTILSNKFKTDSISSGGTWESTTVLNQKPGVYMFSSVQQQGLNQECCCFILMISSNGTALSLTPIELSSNFSNYFTIDGSTLVLSAINVTSSRRISYVKIGEVL